MGMLSDQYIIDQFYKYCKRPVYKRYARLYNSECPFCHEGKSSGKKRRFYYIPQDDHFFCHNCNWNGNSINFILKVSGKSYSELLSESKNYQKTNISIKLPTVTSPPISVGTLPDDSINLYDEQQLKYYQNDKVVKDVLRFIDCRRLNTAINRPRGLFISLKDPIHKNRLCIPFYDEDNQIRYYQTRAIYKADSQPKYLSKLNSDKTVFGVRNINPNIETLFIFEGPIDACFAINGIAVGGIHISEKQEQILNKYKLMNRIWIMDNEFYKDEIRKKVEELIERDEKIFFWPKELKEFKDINELCVKTKRNEIPIKLFLDNNYSGLEALLKLKH